MEQTTASGAYAARGDNSGTREGHFSAVSWGAVAAGAFVAAALSLTLLALGAGFDLATVSPWSRHPAGGPAVGTGALIWLIVVEIVASGMGGYIAGRLRTKWVAIHTHEVYFRDTAHGFLVWAVAAVATAAFLGPAANVMVGSTATGGETTSLGYERFVNLLFRPALTTNANSPTSSAGIGTNPALRLEAQAVLTDLLRSEDTAQADREYLTQLVSVATGLSQADASQRVSDVIARAQQAITAGRKATARLLLWTCLALLLGAFCASYAATIGGRQRDHMPPM